MGEEQVEPIDDPSYWTRSKWTPDDLDHKTVAFQLPGAQGVGVFVVAQNPDGLLFVQIETDCQGNTTGQRLLTLRPLLQSQVDRISRHSDQTVAVFALA